MESLKNAVKNIDQKIGKSTFGRIFRFEGSGHEKERIGSKFFTEIRAGLTTFVTMAYIISVNASIVSQSGGTCVCNDTIDPSCSNNAEYSACITVINRDLITATAAISGVSSIIFGLLTNLPIALAPGMGLNAYFTYQVVGFHGTGSVSYRLALTAVFIEGFIIVFLALIGMRQWLVKIIPASIKVASGVGIGLFLTEIGLSYSAGIGAITGSAITPTDLGGCPPEYIDATGACASHKLQNPTLWIGIFCGGFVTAYLMAYKVKSAIIIGIGIVSIISWPRTTSFTYFPYTDDGNARGAGSHFALALFTFLYVDIIDCTATLYSMAHFSGSVDLDTGDFPHSTLAYCIDALSLSAGSLLGTSPVTAFIESGAGIAEGGKTGLTAITTGVCFLISILFSPIFASIPPWATGCTLILVGFLMMRQVILINWRYIGDALPAFVTFIFMPLTYSVAYGLIAGLLTYLVINILIYITGIISRGRIEAADGDLAEYWTINPQGGTPPWFIRASMNRGRFWESEKAQEEEVKSE